MPPKSKKLQCPNPLFLQWLEEWKCEAEDRGLNSKWTYQKVFILKFLRDGGGNKGF